MNVRPTWTVDITVLRDFMERLLKACGCDEENARMAASVLLEADMRGVFTMGLDHIFSLIFHIRTKKIDPTAKPKLVRESIATALIDGNCGPGQVASIMACDLAVTKAKKAGSATVAVTNSSDLFFHGYYAERIADAGCVGLVFSDAPPQVRPEGGVEGILGTNSMAIGVPTVGGWPFLLDMAVCARSGSWVREAAYRDEAIPEALVLDLDGRSIVDAKEIRELLAEEKAAIGPFGGGKGFGLSLMVAVLSGPLTGSTTGRGLRTWRTLQSSSVFVPEGGGVKGHTFIAVDPASFGDPQAFRVAASRYIAELKGSKKAPGVSEIRIPGGLESTQREKSVKRGHVVMDEAIWQSIAKISADLGVEMPT